jgi:hypothetical protein
MKYPKPSQYPRLIQVGKATYHVCFYSKLLEDDMGYCDPDAKVLGISRRQSAKEMFATFLHEWSHAFEYEFKCPLGHPTIRKLEWAMLELFFQCGPILSESGPLRRR